LVLTPNLLQTGRLRKAWILASDLRYLVAAEVMKTGVEGGVLIDREIIEVVKDMIGRQQMGRLSVVNAGESPPGTAGKLAEDVSKLLYCDRAVLYRRSSA
jgi:hypothetical protein